MALVPVSAHLSLPERHEIANQARQKNYGCNGQLYGIGEENSTLMIVHSGRVKIHRLAESSREQLIGFLQPGDFIGETSFIGADETNHFAVTLEDAQICALPRNACCTKPHAGRRPQSRRRTRTRPPAPAGPRQQIDKTDDSWRRPCQPAL